MGASVARSVLHKPRIPFLQFQTLGWMHLTHEPDLTMRPNSASTCKQQERISAVQASGFRVGTKTIMIVKIAISTRIIIVTAPVTNLKVP